jgi:hypothetical protein
VTSDPADAAPSASPASTAHRLHASRILQPLEALFGEGLGTVEVAVSPAGSQHQVAAVAVTVRLRGSRRVLTATGVARDAAAAIRTAALDALADGELLEDAFERLVEDGKLEAAIIRWGDRPLTFAGDADVDLRLIALFDLTLVDLLPPGGRLAICTDRFAYRLVGGRPALALAARPGASSRHLDRLAALIEEVVEVHRVVAGAAGRTRPDHPTPPLAPPGEVAAAIGSALGETVRWLRIEVGSERAEFGGPDPCRVDDEDPQPSIN